MTYSQGCIKLWPTARWWVRVFFDKRKVRIMSFWYNHKTAILKGSLKVLLLLVFAICVLGLFSAKDYPAGKGNLNLRLDHPSNLTGQVVFPLGPIGSLRFKTHKTPVNIDINYTIDENQTKLDAKFIDSVSVASLKPQVIKAIEDFVPSRIPWILALGALAGVFLTNGGGNWFTKALRHSGYGAAVSIALFVPFIVLTWLTIDRTPTIVYQGWVGNIPQISKVMRDTTGETNKKSSNLTDYISGLGAVSLQLQEAPNQQEEEDTIRVLCVSDVHGNAIGEKLVLEAIRSENISLVLLAGDMTSYGSAAEAQLFASEIPARKVPVYFVGGNHEDIPAMEAFEKAGYKNLAEVEVFEDQLAILGQNDPAALTSDIDIPEGDKALSASAAKLKEVWDNLYSKPQILLVHKKEQAADVIAEAKKTGQDLVVVYGDDHKASLTEEAGVTLIDIGTSGASGYANIDHDPYTFQVLDFSNTEVPKPLYVTTFTISPNGKVTIERAPID